MFESAMQHTAPEAGFGPERGNKVPFLGEPGRGNKVPFLGGLERSGKFPFRGEPDEGWRSPAK